MVPESVRAGQYYVTFEGVEAPAPGVVFTQGCFFWNTEGPFCVPPAPVGATGGIPVRLVTRNPGTYRLSGYLDYWWKGALRRSNRVSATLRVTP